jgi:alkanesulfonate monooxygenase
MMRLLENGGPLTFDGAFYTSRNLKLTPPLSKSLLPGVFVSGSWDAGLGAAKAMGATAIKFPKPASEEDRPANGRARLGGRVGIIARDRGDRAWTMARSRFPEDRRSAAAQGAADEESPYWLGPFKNYKTMYPYLVGSYETVARELRRYIALGYETFIVDVPTIPTARAHQRGLRARAARRAVWPRGLSRSVRTTGVAWRGALALRRVSQG